MREAVKTEASLLEQLTAFLYSVILGVCAGAGYDVVKIIRLALCRKKIWIFLLDFFYSVLLSVVVFIFSIAYMNGTVRLFIALGVCLGFVAFRLSTGRLLSRLYSPFIASAARAFVTISEKIKKIIKKLLKTGGKILYNKSVKKRTSVSDNLSPAVEAVSFKYEKK